MYSNNCTKCCLYKSYTNDINNSYTIIFIFMTIIYEGNTHNGTLTLSQALSSFLLGLCSLQDTRVVADGVLFIDYRNSERVLCVPYVVCDEYSYHKYPHKSSQSNKVLGLHLSGAFTRPYKRVFCRPTPSTIPSNWSEGDQ